MVCFRVARVVNDSWAFLFSSRPKLSPLQNSTLWVPLWISIPSELVDYSGLGPYRLRLTFTAYFSVYYYTKCASFKASSCATLKRNIVGQESNREGAAAEINAY